MFLWILQVGLISLILIFLVHHIFDFLKTTLTVPKVKDLVNSNNMKYQSIAQVLENSRRDDVLEADEEVEAAAAATLNQDIMKNELKNFLKKQMNNDTEPSYGASTSTSLSALPWQ
jgi:hypothetical protein